MKRIISNALLVLSIVLVAYSCNQAPVKENKTEVVNIMDPIFTQNPAIGDFLTKFFSGDVQVNMMLKNDENNEYSIANVIFDPSARTNWHTHPKGQVLLVLEGNGFYQEEGKPVQKLTKGDVVNIPPHVNHWHGAAPDSKFVHVAITNYKDGVNVVWGEKVTEDDYNIVCP